MVTSCSNILLTPYSIMQSILHHHHKPTGWNLHLSETVCTLTLDVMIFTQMVSAAKTLVWMVQVSLILYTGLSVYLVSDMGWCTNREAQAQHHAGCLGDETDQVERGGRLVRRTVKTELIESFFIFMN